jgi:NAD(P)-dependent dehydrogenase (short-subunit alcohol dehydrogenase family)
MSGNLAIVTGASSGIGFSLAKELASRGYDLVVCSAGRRLPEAADTIRPFGTDIIDVIADLSTSEGVDSLWKSVADLGRPVIMPGTRASPVPNDRTFLGDRSEPEPKAT